MLTDLPPKTSRVLVTPPGMVPGLERRKGPAKPARRRLAHLTRRASAPGQFATLKARQPRWRALACLR